MNYYPTYVPLVERLRDRYSIQENGCWIWTGSTSEGYGKINIEGHSRFAHKALYEEKFGKVPNKKELDHIVCNESRCVNPDHLKPVSHLHNVQRGSSSKFTNEFCNMILDEHRTLGTSHRALAKKYGVSKTHIGRIVNDRLMDKLQ